MKKIEALTMPKLLFAHRFEAESYKHSFVNTGELLEITYIAEGSLNINIGNETFKANKGDIVCFFHDEGATVTSDSFHRHHTVGASFDYCCSESPDSIHLPLLLSEKNGTDKICRMIDEIIGDSATMKASCTKFAARFFGLLLNIDAVHKRCVLRVPGEELYVRKIKEYVNSNIHLAISQKNAAEHLGISPGYLCNIFKKNTGVPFMKYVNRIKLENIKSIMDRENIPLYKAAALYGYSDPNYVSRLYAQMFGHSITKKLNSAKEI